MDKIISEVKKHGIAVAVGVLVGVYLYKKHPSYLAFLPF